MRVKGRRGLLLIIIPGKHDKLRLSQRKTLPTKKEDVLKPINHESKCFILGGHSHSDSQDLAYPSQTSEREGNPTRY